MNPKACIVVLLMASFAVSGCLRDNELEDGAPLVPAAEPGVTFDAPVLAFECTCDEASIAWDGNGVLLVTDASGTHVTVSRDDGATWVDFPVNNRQPLPQFANIQSDSQLQTDPQGRVWLSVLRISPTGGGVHVLSTTDAGQTWETDAWVETTLNPVANAPDRQWLGFTDDGVLLFCICAAGGVPGIFESTDGSAFAFREAVVPPGTRNTPWGMPAVFADGRVFWPYFSAACQSQAFQGLGVMVASQSELGWTSTAVKEPGVDRIVPCGFPNAAHNETHVAVTWNQVVGSTGRSMLSFSDGAGWSNPLVLSKVEAGYPQPWVEALPNGRWATMSYGVGAQRDVVLSIWEPTRLLQSIPLGISKGSTDLPHFAVGPDGRIAAVWVDETGIQVAVQRAEGPLEWA